MGQSAALRQRARRMAFLGLIIFLSVCAITVRSGFSADGGHESVPILSASKILPPALLNGPNHKVQERVVNDGFQNIYTIDSKFGQFRAVSTALLRTRVQEIDAMATMDKLKGTKEYGTAVKESALSAMVAAKDMVFQPVQTLKTAASGVAVAFRRAGDLNPRWFSPRGA